MPEGNSENSQFDFDPRTRATINDFIEGLPKGKDSTLEPDSGYGPINVPNVYYGDKDKAQLINNDYKKFDSDYTPHLIPNELVKQGHDSPYILEYSDHEKSPYPSYLLDGDKVNDYKIDLTKLIDEPSDVPVIDLSGFHLPGLIPDYLKNRFPNLDDLTVSIFNHEPLDEVDPLTSPDYWRVAGSLGIKNIGRLASTPIYNQLHDEIHGSAE